MPTDAEAVRAQLETLFKKQSKVAYERIVREHVDTPATRIVIDTPEKENATIMARFAFPAHKDDADGIAMHVANWIFGGSTGLSNRLMMRLRQQDGLSYGAGSSVMLPSFGNDASWSMQAILAPQNMVKAEKALLEEIDRVLKDGFTQEELDEAKKGYTDYRAINRSQDGIVASQWIALMKEGRDWTESKENDEKIRRLTLKDVNDAFKKMVDPKRLTIVLAGDQKKANEQ